ncbi:hypothetical protein [Pseudomonas frederiksbergensis]|uniref:Uncharacterized protein n=1 Tax=Pseudomonas frederiksbergensis TaxID=104087 RepID=A0A423HGK1_9PSED|nr:hypothetical protein [Pseudomonas frederiksbergensis]RON12197.1 hypothetical protein BK662_24560 [Pseudomonas frederiksbergensis]
MHTYVKSLIAALLISSPLPVLATDEHHPETAPAAPTTDSTQTTPIQDKAMSEQMQKMQAAHDKMIAAKTPAERQAAMQEAMTTMKNGMGMMHDNCKGMGMGMSGGKDGQGTAMMDMMMKMMDQQSSMMKTPMGQ